MSEQGSESVDGRTSGINKDEELSSNFSTTVYGSDSIQQGLDNEANNTSLNRDEELSSDFSTTVYKSVSLHKGSNNVQIYDILCDTCKRDGKKINAEGYCVDCNEYLCQDCYAFHKKLKAVQHHVLLDKQNMPSEKLKAKVKDICEEKCPSHTDKVTEYFCQSCDELGCTACITTKHHKCSRVDHIPNIVTRLEDSIEFKEITGALQDISVQLEHNQSRYDTNILKKSYLKEKAKRAVKQHREVMSKILDKFEEDIDKEIETMDAYNEDMLKSVSSMQKSLTFNLQTITTDLEKNQHADQRCKLFTGMKIAKHTIIRLQDELLRLDVNNHIVRYQFEESEKYEDLLKEIKGSGKIELLHSSTKQEEVKRDNIYVKTSVDKMNCTISALCLLPEDKLIAADVRNETLKVIQVKAHTILSTRVMSSKPWDVTRVNDSQVVTSLPDEGKIQFLSVDESGSMSIDNEIEVNGCCRGLAYSQGHLVVSFDKPESKLEILDTSGNVCKSFARDSLGNQLFTKPWYLALSPDQYTIYVSDNSRYTVTSLTLEGKVNAIYQESDLRKPVGLTVDPDGSVYVVGSSMYSSTIHKLTDNCRKVQVFENYSHGIACPRCITYCRKEHKLYVGMEFSDSMLVVSLKSTIT